VAPIYTASLRRRPSLCAPSPFSSSSTLELGSLNLGFGPCHVAGALYPRTKVDTSVVVVEDKIYPLHNLSRLLTTKFPSSLIILILVSRSDHPTVLQITLSAISGLVNMLIAGEKYACQACVRSHRVGNCRQADRPLQHINKKACLPKTSMSCPNNS
jgi:hypothetical protein